MSDELKWCPASGFAALLAQAMGTQISRPPMCLGETCGAFHLCTGGAFLEDDCDDDDDDRPDEVEGEDGNVMEVLPRSAGRLEFLKDSMIEFLQAKGTEFNDITCLDCDAASMCEFAFHLPNIDGHCEAEK